MSDDYKKGNRLSPHDDEEDFDWKKTESEEDLGLAVVYPKSSHGPETRAKIKELGFKWIDNRWEIQESKLDLEDGQFEELILQDIVIDWL